MKKLTVLPVHRQCLCLDDEHLKETDVSLDGNKDKSCRIRFVLWNNDDKLKGFFRSICKILLLFLKCS